AVEMWSSTRVCMLSLLVSRRASDWHKVRSSRNRLKCPSKPSGSGQLLLPFLLFLSSSWNLKSHFLPPFRYLTKSPPHPHLITDNCSLYLLSIYLPYIYEFIFFYFFSFTSPLFDIKEYKLLFFN